MFKLRWYQEGAINAALSNVGKVGSQLICIPTGGGKSIVIAEIIRKSLEENYRFKAIMLTHRKELIHQNYLKLKSIFPQAPAGIFSAGLKSKDSLSPIVFGGIQSVAAAMKRNAHTFNVYDMVIIDEAHMMSESVESSYGYVIGKLREANPNLSVVGLTATPYRMKNGMLVESGIFDKVTYDICNPTDFIRLIDEGYLSNLVVPSKIKKINRQELQSSSFDFTEESSKSSFDLINESIIADINDLLSKDRKKAIVFASGIEHVELLYKLAIDAGLSAGMAHSKLGNEVNDETIKAFSDGRLSVLINADKLTTGFDVPDIDVLVCARPTKSTALWVQMLGRGTRVHSNKKDCLVLDYAGNTEELGTINNPIVRAKSKSDGKGMAPLKVCDCGIYLAAQQRECPSCGKKFAFDAMPKIDFNPSSADVITRPRVDFMSVDSMTITPYTSKSGRDMYKATYVCGFEIVDEYLYSMEMLASAKRQPKVILVDKTGKYKTIVGKRY